MLCTTRSCQPLIRSLYIENFLFNTSSALASSWNPIAASPPAGAGPEAAARGLLVALPLPPLAPAGALIDSGSEGCSNADRLALLLLLEVVVVLLLLDAGGDCDIVLGGGVARSRCWGSGPGMLRPGPSGASCANWCLGDSSLMRTWARYGGEVAAY